MTGDSAVLIGAKPAASPVHPSNGTFVGAMAELVEPAATRRLAEGLRGFIRTAPSLAPAGGKAAMPLAHRPKIPAAAPPYGLRGRIGRPRYFAVTKIQVTSPADNRLVDGPKGPKTRGPQVSPGLGGPP